MPIAEGIQYEPWNEWDGDARSSVDSAALGTAGRRLWGKRMLKRFGDNQEAFASNSELAPTRLGMTIEEQWPALKLVGFGFYYAWIWVSYNSNVLVFPSAASDLPPDTISLTYLVSTLALGVALVLLSLVRPLTRRLVGSNLLLIAVAVVVGAATVGTYASSSLGADANLYLIVSAALTGAGTSVIVLRFGVVYSKAPAREAAMYTAASFVFAAMIYFMAVGLPDPVGMVFTALLPVLAVVSTLTNPEWSDEGEGGRPEGPVPLRRFFVRLLVAAAVFSVVVGVSRGFSVPHSSISSLNADGALIIFSTAVVAGVLFVVVGLLRRQFDVSRLYYPIIIAVAAGILVTPLLGGTGFRQPVHYGGLQLLRAGDLVSAGLCGLLVAAFPDIGVRLGPRGLGFGDDLRLAGGFGNCAQPGRRQLVLGGYLGGHGLRAPGSLHAGAERPPDRRRVASGGAPVG